MHPPPPHESTSVNDIFIQDPCTVHKMITTFSYNKLICCTHKIDKTKKSFLKPRNFRTCREITMAATLRQHLDLHVER